MKPIPLFLGDDMEMGVAKATDLMSLLESNESFTTKKKKSIASDAFHLHFLSPSTFQPHHLPYAAMLPTKHDKTAQSSPGRIEGSRQRLASLFAGFSIFGSPAKPSARAASTSSLDLSPVVSRVLSNSSRTSRGTGDDEASGSDFGDTPQREAGWDTESVKLGRPRRAGLLDLPDEL
jgi:hypothetical protein